MRRLRESFRSPPRSAVEGAPWCRPKTERPLLTTSQRPRGRTGIQPSPLDLMPTQREKEIEWQRPQRSSVFGEYRRHDENSGIPKAHPEGRGKRVATVGGRLFDKHPEQNDPEPVLKHSAEQKTRSPSRSDAESMRDLQTLQACMCRPTSGGPVAVEAHELVGRRVEEGAPIGTASVFDNDCLRLPGVVPVPLRRAGVDA